MSVHHRGRLFRVVLPVFMCRTESCLRQKTEIRMWRKFPINKHSLETCSLARTAACWYYLNKFLPRIRLDGIKLVHCEPQVAHAGLGSYWCIFATQLSYYIIQFSVQEKLVHCCRLSTPVLERWQLRRGEARAELVRKDVTHHIQSAL